MESNKQRQLTTTILSILFLCSLCYAACHAFGLFELKKDGNESKEKAPEYFDYGVIADNTYCNDFFGFRIPITEGHQGEHKIDYYSHKSYYEKDSALAKSKLVSDITEHNLVIIQRELIEVDLLQVLKETGSSDSYWKYHSDKRKTEFYGPDYDLIIRANNLNGEKFSVFAGQFSNIHNPDYGDSKTKIISGIEFHEYQGKSTSHIAYKLVGGEDKKIVSYMTEINGFAFSINLFYKTEEQKCIMLEMIDEIKFH